MPAGGSFWAAGAAAVLATVFVRTAGAAPGDVDATYGDRGAYVKSDSFLTLALSDGRVLSVDVDESFVYLRRADSEGRLDTRFGQAGQVAILKPTAYPYYARWDAWVSAVAEASDGAIYLGFAAAGAAARISVLGKLSPAGDLDERFGDGGWVVMPVEDSIRALKLDSIAPLADGAVAVATTIFGSDTFLGCALHRRVFRFLPTGAPATDFPPGGARVDHNGYCVDGSPGRLKQLAGGRLIYSFPSWQQSAPLNLMFFDLQGRPAPYPAVSKPYVLGSYLEQFPTVIEPSGDARWNYAASDTFKDAFTVQLSRFGADLAQDLSFGSGEGVTIVDFKAAAEGVPIYSVALNPAKQFLYLTVQTRGSEGRSQPASIVARLDLLGRLDTSFGNQGFARIPGFFEREMALGEQPAGGLLLDLAAYVVRLSASSTPGAGLIALDIPASAAQGSASRVVRLTVKRILGNRGVVSVAYRLESGTAEAGKDFADARGQLTWADGESGAKVIDVPILSDDAWKNARHFTIKMETLMGSAVLPVSGALVYVMDTPAASSPVPPSASSPSPPAATAPHQGGGSADGVFLAALGLLWWRRKMLTGRGPRYS